MAIDTLAGSKFFIGPANNDANDATAYGLLTFEEVGEVETWGNFGRTYNSVTFNAMGDRRTRKMKGTYNEGDPTFTVAFDGADAGQAAVEAALDSDDDYAIKLELSDGATTNTIFYFRAKIMGAAFNLGNSEAVIRRDIQLGINSDIVRVAAT